MAGETAIDQLAVGDLIITASGEAVPIKWIGHRRILCARHLNPVSVWPVRVRQAAFGPGRPTRDLILSPDHALFLGGVLIPVHVLIDGNTIRQEQAKRIEYFHVELNRHDILLDDGLPVESYLDTGNRQQFANAPIAALHPNVGAGEAESSPYARLVFSEPEVTAIRLMVANADVISKGSPAAQVRARE